MNNVVYIGPDYHNHRGGIGAVLEVYAKHIRPFRFISTYSGKSSFHRLSVYIQAVFKLIYLLVTDRKVKIIHMHSASRGSFFRKSIILLIGKLFGKKTILHLHAAEFKIYYANAGLLRPYIRFIMNKADAVLCLSENWKQYYAENFNIRRLEVINNIIEPVHHSVKPTERNGRVRLLFLGYIGQRKGIFNLLEVLGANREKFKDNLMLTIGGDGEIDRLKQTLADKNLGDEVVYEGWVSGEKKNTLLEQCDIYILPSYNEGLPISILEAMAYSKPIISTFVGGIPEIVKPGYNGWLIEAGDQVALKLAIEEAISSESRLKQYGDNSLKLSQNYTPQVVIRSLETLYKNLLAS